MSRRRVRFPNHPVADVAVTVLGWLAALAAVAVLWPVQLGGHLGLTIVTGHSMEPTFHTGDVAVTWRTASYRHGQAVVYKIPADEPGAGHRVVHRITAGSGSDGFTTQGDNNPSADFWTPRTHDVQGAVITAVPRVGNLLLTRRSPLLPALGVGLLVTLALWSRAREQDREVQRAEPEADGSLLQARHAAEVSTRQLGALTQMVQMAQAARGRQEPVTHRVDPDHAAPHASVDDADGGRPDRGRRRLESSSHRAS